jgi:hypothetical protein
MTSIGSGRKVETFGLTERREKNEKTKYSFSGGREISARGIRT